MTWIIFPGLFGTYFWENDANPGGYLLIQFNFKSLPCKYLEYIPELNRELNPEIIQKWD